MQPKGNNTLLQKLLITFLISGMAITGLYLLSRQVFFEINQSFRTLSQPNQKLNAVNRLFAEIVLSDKSFSDLMANGKPKSLLGFISHSDAITAYTDSLRVLCADNFRQTSLIDSIHNLVILRKQKLLRHFSNRQVLNRKNNITSDIRVLDSLITSDTSKGEITIFSNRETITTTTYDTIEYEERRKGILNRIFKPKKKTSISIPVEETMVLENSDTLTKEPENEGIEEAQKVMAGISKKRHAVQNELKQREVAINTFEKEFKEKVTTLLYAIEGNIIQQTEEVQAATGETLERNVAWVRYILIGFGVASAILFILMVFDMARSNKYRRLLEEATKKAEQASQSKQALLSNVSHEIRTPLQSVIGYAEQLQQQPGNPAFTVAIAKASAHLLQVVNEVLDYSSIEAGKYVFNPIDFDAESVIEEVMVLMQINAVAKGLELKLENELSEDAALKGDPFRLKQILMNLLGNAIKFTEQGSITLTVNGENTPKGWLMSFSITDTGIGISEAEQEKIFGRFEQVSIAGNTTSGTGLGLSITRAIVEAQGGTIGLKSTPGKGSVFSFSIPYEKGNAVVLQSENIVVSPNISGEIWFLDDDKLIGQLVSIILEKHKISHRIFTSGEDLVLALDGHPPNMVLTDISLPGMSGTEVCSHIRRLRPEIKVVAITAHALPLEQQALLQQGFDWVVSKPFTEAELLATLSFGVKQQEFSLNEPEEANPAINRMKKATGLEDESFPGIAFQFYTDMHADMDALQTAIGEEDAEAQTELLHRVAGRMAQVGFTELAVSFRQQEVFSKQKALDGRLLQEPWWKEVQNVLIMVNNYLNLLAKA